MHTIKQMRIQLTINPLRNQNVCIVGNLNIDLIIRSVPHLPDWGQEVFGSDYLLTSSGQSAYTSFALRKYNVPTKIIGNVGDDVYGDKIITDLEKTGINTTEIEKVPKGKTGITVAIVRKDGERAFVSDPSSLVMFNRGMIERHLEPMQSASFVCIVGSFFLPDFSFQDIRFCCEQSQKTGSPTLLDTGWDPENWPTKTIKDLRGILKYVDYFIPNMDEAGAITGRKSPEKAAEDLLSDGCKTVIIKLGEKGSYLRTNENEIFVPPYKVNVFDAVGAGDVYNAGFIFGTLQNWPLEARMIFGSATAALYISKPTNRFPELKETTDYTNVNKKYVFKEIQQL
jgi:ribokinase